MTINKKNGRGKTFWQKHKKKIMIGAAGVGALALAATGSDAPLPDMSWGDIERKRSLINAQKERRGPMLKENMLALKYVGHKASGVADKIRAEREAQQRMRETPKNKDKRLAGEMGRSGLAGMAVGTVVGGPVAGLAAGGGMMLGTRLGQKLRGESYMNENIKNAIDSIVAGENNDQARQLIHSAIGEKVLEVLADKKVQLAQAIFSGVDINSADSEE
jgi:hypothetical protein